MELPNSHVWIGNLWRKALTRNFFDRIKKHVIKININVHVKVVVICLYLSYLFFYLKKSELVRALLKGEPVLSTLVNIPPFPFHFLIKPPWLKSLSLPVIFSYPSNTPSACRWRVFLLACGKTFSFSAWYVTHFFLLRQFFFIVVNLSLDHQQQKIRVVSTPPLSLFHSS